MINDNKEDSKIKSRTGEIHFESIHNQNLIFFSHLFSLYEANYTVDDNTLNVYMIEFKFLDPFQFGCLIDELHIKKLIENKKNQNTEHTLKRLGFYYNKQENLFYLLYLKENKKVFHNINEFIKSSKMKNFVLVKMQIFYELLKITHHFHVNGKKVGLFHPSLLFYDGDRFYLADTIIDDIISLLDKYSNFQICSYFGYFDLEKIEEIDLDDEVILFKKYNESLYFKTDIVALSVFLVYLFSSRIVNCNEESLCKTYDQVIYELQRDFFMQSELLSNFTYLCRDHKRITTFIAQNLYLNYDNLPGIDEYLKNFEVVVKEEFDPVECVECRDKELNHSQDNGESKEQNFDISVEKYYSNKIINFTCMHVLCSKCAMEHSTTCSILKEKQQESFQEKVEHYHNQVEDLKDLSHKLPALEEKLISEDFVRSLSPIFEEINEEHMRIKRTIQQEEEKLNSIIQFMQDLLLKTQEEKYSNLQTELESLQKELVAKKQNVQHVKRNEIKTTTKKVTRRFSTSAGLSNQISLGLPSLGLYKIDGFEVHLKLMNKSINQYNDFVRESGEFVNHVNYNMKMNYALETIRQKAIDLENELETKFTNEFKSTVDNLIKDLCTSIQSTVSTNSELVNEYLLSEQFTGESFYYMKMFKLDWRKKEVDLVNITEQTTTRLKLLMNGKKKDILKECRYLHLKTGLLVTGGLSENGGSSRNAFMIKYEDEKTPEDVREIKALTDMKTGRDQHMMISTGVFTVMCLGGSKTNKCEEFNLVEDTWTEFPSLNKIRFNASVYLHNESSVYVFLGQIISDGAIKFSEDIERLDLISGEQWETIKINFESGIPKQISLAGIFKATEDKGDVINLIGGKTEKGGILDTYLIFNFEDQKLFDSGKKSEKLFYEESNLLLISENEFKCVSFSIC